MTFQAKQRVKILESQVKAKIEDVDDTSQDLIVSVDGSDEQRKVAYNMVQPDRNLRSGDHVKVSHVGIFWLMNSIIYNFCDRGIIRFTQSHQ